MAAIFCLRELPRSARGAAKFNSSIHPMRRIIEPAERTYDCSLIGRLNRWRTRSVCGRRKNSYEFDCDQRQEHEQVNSQGPKCDPHRAGHFDTWHILVSASNESLHYIPRMNNSEQAVLLIDYGNHMKLIPGE